MQNNREYNIKLFDYYGDLLTDHQIEILNDYLNEDLSMNEISENYNISKSAVQDLIKRTMNQLNNYENKLKLIENDSKLDNILVSMANENNALLNKYIKKIQKIK
ncbi:MAG: DNA-binding protein [Firmicutes bacterium]|nr:DNA-binding protein [Candidatus Colivicinus equi]